MTLVQEPPARTLEEPPPPTQPPPAPKSPLQLALEAMRETLAASFVTPPVPSPGEAVVAAIRPELGTIEVASLLKGELELAWVTKNVFFTNADPVANLSLEELAKATLAGKSDTFTGAEKTPGLLGAVQGLIPFATTVQVPVSAQVTWEVLDSNNKVIEEKSGAFKAPNGLNGTELTVLFAPALVRPSEASGFAVYKLRAKVSLSAGGAAVDERTLDPIEVRVPALPIPTVLAMFVHSNFQPRHGDDEGAVLVAVPPGSPVGGLSQLQTLLDTLQTALGRLSRFAKFAGFLTGVSELASALSAHPVAHIQFRETNGIANLNDVTLVQRSWWENDTEAEDEISSIIVVGYDGATVEFFEDRDYKGRRFKLKTGPEHLALMRSLHGSDPKPEFGSIPDGGKAAGLADLLSAFQFVE